MKRYNKKEKYPLEYDEDLATGFLFVIVTGAAFYGFRSATRSRLNSFDALFTSAFAVCVTGLVTIIPQTQFTLFGKVTLLILIQIGGLGIIACVTAFFFSYADRLLSGSVWLSRNV